MKKILLITFAVLTAFLMVSCEPKGPSTITVSVRVEDAHLSDTDLPDSYEVVLTNFNTAEQIKGNSENGSVVFPGIVPGIYKVTASAIVVSGGFTYTLTGMADNVSFLEEGDQIAVKVDAAKESALIFKEIYYSGAPGDGYYFRDQFYEIYNNSDEVVYADGICIAETYFANYDFSVFFQYEVPGADAKDYVFAQVIWQIPGDGTQYPIQPGESFVIAQWGTDHRDETLSKGLSVMNLKGAEFEAFCGEKTTWTGVTLTDEAAVNMSLEVNARGFAPLQWLTPVSGSNYILFKPSTPLRHDNFLAPTNSEGTLDSVHEILLSDVIDAVQAVGDETRLQTLGMPSVLDAGAIWCSGIYTGESISRKVKETREDGRIIYQDTNNTTNDFEVNATPEIRRNGAGTPSWNTWK